MEIVKFGGSSLATATNWRLCYDIVQSTPKQQIIVVSAPGKYGNYTTKITDDLIRLAKGEPIINQIFQRFEDLGNSLLTQSKQKTYQEILYHTRNEILNRPDDYNFIVSRGEYLSAQLGALYFNYRFVDAKDILVINPDATINLTATRERIKRHKLKQKIPFVIGGFYGQYNDHIALFTRGGSDYTGAILAALMHAAIYKNYTDTNGIQTADPRMVYNTKTISCLDFDALDILTHNGAGIIHENVAALLKAYRVPLRVDNTFNPNRNFTEVHSQRCQNCQSNFFCVTKHNDNIVIMKKKINTPISVQMIQSTPETIVTDVQKLHATLLQDL